MSQWYSAKKILFKFMHSGLKLSERERTSYIRSPYTQIFSNTLLRVVIVQVRLWHDVVSPSKLKMKNLIKETSWLQIEVASLKNGATSSNETIIIEKARSGNLLLWSIIYKFSTCDHEDYIKIYFMWETWLHTKRFAFKCFPLEYDGRASIMKIHPLKLMIIIWSPYKPCYQIIKLSNPSRFLSQSSYVCDPAVKLANHNGNKS